METLSLIVALATGAAAGGTTFGLMRGKLLSIEHRLSSIERRLAEAHRRIDSIMNHE